VVDGGLTYGCTESFQVESAVPGGPRLSNEALRCAAAYSVVERAVGDREIDSRQAGCATPRRLVRVNALKSGGSGPEEELSQGNSTGHRTRDRRSRERKKSSASLVERRRSGPGKASSRHGGGVEAVSASLSESAQRAPRKARTGIEERIATGASEVGRRVRGSAQQAPTVRKTVRRSDHRAS